jgi:hypothetical protein
MCEDSGAWRVARLFGAAEKLRQAIGLPQTYLDRSRCEQAIATTRAELGPPSFDELWAGGRGLTLAQAIEEALNATIEQSATGHFHTVTAARSLANTTSPEVLRTAGRLAET